MAQANSPGKMAQQNTAGVMPLGHPLQLLLLAMVPLLPLRLHLLQRQHLLQLRLLHLLQRQELPHLLQLQHRHQPPLQPPK